MKDGQYSNTKEPVKEGVGCCESHQTDKIPGDTYNKLTCKVINEIIENVQIKKEAKVTNKDNLLLLSP